MSTTTNDTFFECFDPENDRFIEDFDDVQNAAGPTSTATPTQRVLLNPNPIVADRNHTSPLTMESLMAHNLEHSNKTSEEKVGPATKGRHYDNGTTNESITMADLRTVLTELHSSSSVVTNQMASAFTQVIADLKSKDDENYTKDLNIQDKYDDKKEHIGSWMKRMIATVRATSPIAVQL